MKAFLKFGGLGLSALLTIGLFINLFGPTPYGITLAVFALVLFEGGAMAWASLLQSAKHGQRTVAKFAQWFCVLASIASSGAQIILGTNLWEPGFDVGFVTLLVIVAALAVNLAGAVAFEQLDPERAERNRELDRQAKARQAAAKLEDRVIDQSLLKAESRVQEISGDVSDRLANELRGDVVSYLLSQTRGGANTLPVFATAAQRPSTPRPESNPDDDRYFAPELDEAAAMSAPKRKASANGHKPDPKA